MSGSQNVVVYAYSQSPMWHKIRNVLLLRRIPHSIVKVASMLPRPELLAIGVTYRRIPLLAIGNDIFIDTSLIFSELERRFTPAMGHPSLLDVHSGLQQATAAFWSDRVLFPLTAQLMPWSSINESFLQDRQRFLGTNADLRKSDARLPGVLSDLAASLMLIADQLQVSNTAFLLSTPTPAYLDIALYTNLAWARGFKTGNHLLALPSSQAPAHLRPVMQWFEAVEAMLKQAQSDRSNPAAKPVTLDSKRGADAIYSGSSSGTALQVDASDPMVSAGWLKGGDWVNVTPTDTGKVPQLGELVGLNERALSIRVSEPDGSRAATLHFPRIGYNVEKVKTTKPRL